MPWILGIVTQRHYSCVVIFLLTDVPSSNNDNFNNDKTYVRSLVTDPIHVVDRRQHLRFAHSTTPKIFTASGNVALPVNDEIKWAGDELIFSKSFCTIGIEVKFYRPALEESSPCSLVLQTRPHRNQFPVKGLLWCFASLLPLLMRSSCWSPLWSLSSKARHNHCDQNFSNQWHCQKYHRRNQPQVKAYLR